MMSLFALVAATMAITESLELGTGPIRHGFGGLTELPTSLEAALAAGWQQESSECRPGFGVTLWNPQARSAKASLRWPVGLGVNPHTGHVTGMTVVINGEVEENLVDLGFWRVVGEFPQVWLGFRPLGDACAETVEDMATGEMVQGDRVVVNPGQGEFDLNLHIPNSELDEELVANYHKGSCVERMGRHWIHDLSLGKEMSWEKKNMQPIVPMYDVHTHNLTAVFVTVPHIQQWTANGWDVAPLLDTLMCQNFCSPECGFDTWRWSTMHILFRDYEQVDCEDPALTSKSLIGARCPEGKSPGIFFREEEMHSLESSSTLLTASLLFSFAGFLM